MSQTKSPFGRVSVFFFSTGKAVASYQNDKVYAALPANIPKDVRTQFGLMWLLTFRNCTWCSFKKWVKGISRVWVNPLPVNVWDRFVALDESHSWMSLCLHSRQSSRTNGRPVWCGTCARDISVAVLKSQFNCHKDLTLMEWSLRYGNYWRAMFHVSLTQVWQNWKKLLWCRGSIFAKKWWRSH